MASYALTLLMEGSGAEIEVGACDESTFVVFGFDTRVPVAELEVGQKLQLGIGVGELTDIQVS